MSSITANPRLNSFKEKIWIESNVAVIVAMTPVC